MILIQDETKTNANIIIDGKHFINCVYTDCTLYYSGEDFEFTGSDFRNCKITMGGHAIRTARFIQLFNVKLEQPKIAESATKRKVK